MIIHIDKINNMDHFTAQIMGFKVSGQIRKVKKYPGQIFLLQDHVRGNSPDDNIQSIYSYSWCLTVNRNGTINLGEANVTYFKLKPKPKKLSTNNSEKEVSKENKENKEEKVSKFKYPSIKNSKKKYEQLDITYV